MGNTQQASNDYQDASACTGFTETGPDQVYKLSLQPGDRVQATLTPSGTAWDASLYMVTSCSNVSVSCVAGSDRAGAGSAESIDYTAVAAGDYDLIADGYLGAGGTYSLQVSITAAPINNDVCGGAIDLGTGGTFAGDTTNATDNYDPLHGGC